MTLRAEPLTAAAFAPFGSVAVAPVPGERVAIGPAENLRPGVPVSLRWAAPRPAVLPLRVVTMERHRFSSQSFVPATELRWLVLVAPHHPAGGPDMAQVRAFLADGSHAVTYAPDTWHHPLTVLTPAARFAVLTFLDDGADDEEFVPVPEQVLTLGPA